MRPHVLKMKRKSSWLFSKKTAGIIAVLTLVVTAVGAMAGWLDLFISNWTDGSNNGDSGRKQDGDSRQSRQGDVVITDSFNTNINYNKQDIEYFVALFDEPEHIITWLLDMVVRVGYPREKWVEAMRGFIADYRKYDKIPEMPPQALPPIDSQNTHPSSSRKNIQKPKPNSTSDWRNTIDELRREVRNNKLIIDALRRALNKKTNDASDDQDQMASEDDNVLQNGDGSAQNSVSDLESEVSLWEKVVDNIEREDEPELLAFANGKLLEAQNALKNRLLNYVAISGGYRARTKRRSATKNVPVITHILLGNPQ